MKKKSRLISRLLSFAMLLFLVIPNMLINAAGTLKVQFYNGITSASSNTIAPKFKIVNNGTAAIDLSTLKLRYYYTIDGEKQQSFWCDYASKVSGYNYSAITSNVTGTLVKAASAVNGADYYLEVGFTSGAGSVEAGGVVEVQSRIAKSDWSNYNQADDYSFNASSSQYVDWDKVTLWQNGTLVSGADPLDGSSIKNSTISPTTAAFYKDPAKQADVVITETLNGNTLGQILNGSAALVKGTDYLEGNGIVTISKSYLANLAGGTANLTFDFSAGIDPVLVLNIVDYTKPTTITVGAGSAAGSAGTTVNVPVTFTGVPSAEVCTCDFKIGFDTNLLEVAGITAGNIVTNPAVNFSYSVNASTGTISFLFLDETLGSQLITQDGTFASIEFKIKSTATAAATPVSVKYIGAFGDKDLNKLASITADGTITIK